MATEPDPIYENLPQGWLLTSVAHLIEEGEADVQTGPFGTMLHASSYRDTGTPVVAVKNIGENRLNHTEIPCVDVQTRTRLGRYQLREGDILLGRKGAVERRALVHREEEGWLQGSDCIRVRMRGTKAQPKFVSFVFGTPQHKNWIVQNAHGATMPSLNQEIVGRIPLPLPPLAEQQAIAHILGTLDDKIELNRRMNETLEAMARAIFKSWFVDFDPVRAKAAGEQPPGLAPHITDLFPYAFEASELGEIPKGWQVGTLGMIAEEVRDTVQAAEIEPGTTYIALQHMPRHCIALNSWDMANDIASAKLRFKTGDILFGKLRPYFHKVGPAPLDGVCSTDIVVCRPQDDLWYGFALGHMSSDAFVAYTNSGSTGTKMPRTNWRYMSAFKIALPPSGVAAQFSEVVQPIFNRIRNSIFEQNTLVTLRDTLLPKLISGELRVPEAEKMVEAAL